MESVTFNLFTALFKFVGVLIVGGVFLAVLMDVQQKAFQSKISGLTSMSKINRQLVGSSKD